MHQLTSSLRGLESVLRVKANRPLANHTLMHFLGVTDRKVKIFLSQKMYLQTILTPSEI
jgi:hypothetical protein